ncbi:MAG: acyltransferase [Gluconacetobacter diazotrophicus]|nr:acyltransferase [Gluconacetobacter diazotrophicus]
MNARSDADERYVFLDGLRGLAALAVVCHHLLDGTVLGPVLGKAFPGPFVFFCHYGARGVQVFFVISGFVIAHALRRVEPTVGAAGNFILRRQLRLDPPYWTALAVALFGTALESRVPGLAPRHLPGVGQVLLNMSYLQNVVGIPQMLGMAWTLCIEVQFYLVFIFLVTLCRAVTSKAVSSLLVSLVGGLGLLSLVERTGDVAAPPWLLPFWFYFAAGIFCYWHLRGQLGAVEFWAFTGALAVVAWRDPDGRAAVGLATVLSFYAVGNARRLTVWLGGTGFSYLGRISYSLYLIHLPVLLVVMRAGYKLTGENRPAAVCWFVLALLASVAAAHLLWRYVEMPSARLARRMKFRPRAPGLPSGAPVPTPPVAVAAEKTRRPVPAQFQEPPAMVTGGAST